MKTIRWSSPNKLKRIRKAISDGEALQVVLIGRAAKTVHENVGVGLITGGEVVAFGILALATVTIVAISHGYSVRVRKRSGDIVIVYQPPRG